MITIPVHVADTIARVAAVARVVEPYALAVDRVAAVSGIASGFSSPRRCRTGNLAHRCAFSQIVR